MTVEDVGFEANSIEIDATLIEREDVRFTPALRFSMPCFTTAADWSKPE